MMPGNVATYWRPKRQFARVQPKAFGVR